MITPWIAFVVWVPISLYCFRRYPVRVAFLINFIPGWGILPSTSFSYSSAPFPYWVLGTCLWSGHFFTKASVTAITGLLGVLLVDPLAFRRFQLTFWDLPMAVWCAVPLFSAFANPQGLLSALGGAVYQPLVWGVPYLAGRLYFDDTESLALAAKAFVLAGLAYIPICLCEFFTGPQLYAHLYGYQPYRWIGAQRYLGFRPIGLLEDGNQLGIWMATSALLATWLWRHRLIGAILGIPIAWVSASLLIITLLCQSGGSIVLLIGLLFFGSVRHRVLPRVLAALLVLAIVGAITLRLANVISLRSLVKHNRVAYASANFLKRIQRGSFGWRLGQDERHVTSALQKPLLGSGQWNWWQASSSRPWSLWLLAFGMYGIVGLLALECIQLFPVARILGIPFAREALEGEQLRSALGAAILMAAIDNLLNGSMILPLLLVVGGLSTSRFAHSVRSTPNERSRSRGHRASRNQVAANIGRSFNIEQISTS